MKSIVITAIVLAILVGYVNPARGQTTLIGSAREVGFDADDATPDIRARWIKTKYIFNDDPALSIDEEGGVIDFKGEVNSQTLLFENKSLVVKVRRAKGGGRFATLTLNGPRFQLLCIGSTIFTGVSIDANCDAIWIPKMQCQLFEGGLVKGASVVGGQVRANGTGYYRGGKGRNGWKYNSFLSSVGVPPQCGGAEVGEEYATFSTIPVQPVGVDIPFAIQHFMRMLTQ